MIIDVCGLHTLTRGAASPEQFIAGSLGWTSGLLGNLPHSHGDRFTAQGGISLSDSDAIPKPAFPDISGTSSGCHQGIGNLSGTLGSYPGTSMAIVKPYWRAHHFF
jgi:hypothetical protein